MNEQEYHLSWVAPAYDHHEHTADWYWAVGIASVSFAVAFVIVGNLLLAIVLLLGVGTLLFYSKNVPQNIEFKITKKGVITDKTIYPWETLDSFWILEGHTTRGKICAPRILLVSKKTFMPHIVIPLTNEVVDDVQEILAHMLEEERQFEPLHDRLTRLLGF